MRHSIILFLMLSMITQSANAGESIVNIYVKPLPLVQTIKTLNIKLDANPTLSAQYINAVLDNKGILIELGKYTKYFSRSTICV